MVLRRRWIAVEYTEKFKQLFDERHPLQDPPEPIRRLKSRWGFLLLITIKLPNDYSLTQKSLARLKNLAKSQLHSNSSGSSEINPNK